MGKKKRSRSLESMIEKFQTVGGPRLSEIGKMFSMSRYHILKKADSMIGKERRIMMSAVRQAERMKGNTRSAGRKFPEEIKERWRTERRGANNPNWQGGHHLNGEVICFRHLKEYREFAEMILDRDGYRCRDCGAGAMLVVHHIISEKEAPELLTDPDNAETLCRSCHLKKHWRGGDL